MDDIAGPGIDAAEFHHVGIAQRGQLIRRLLGAVAAAAVDQDQLVLQGQLGRVLPADVLVGQADGAGDVAPVILRLGAHV